MSVQAASACALAPSRLNQTVTGQFCTDREQRFYRINQYHLMPSFFMSIVSPADHWLFIASNGGLSAGRQNAQRALFPYYTEDKLMDMAHCTGPITLIREGNELWQPLDPNSLSNTSANRSMRKSVEGDQLFFTETANDLEFEYGWRFSERFGLVRTARLTNLGVASRSINLLDGLQNILPANVGSDLQNDNSVLLDAYKTTECLDQNLACFSLSSRLTDLAEPSESLACNSVFYQVKDSAFLPTVTISTKAPEQFALGINNNPTHTSRGHRGAYFIQADITLDAGETLEWHLVGELSQDVADIAKLRKLIQGGSLFAEIEQDIYRGHQQLRQHLAKVDGLQAGADEATLVHHQANALFNCMRGGFFEDGYAISRSDLCAFIRVRHPSLLSHAWWETLPYHFSVTDIEKHLASCHSDDIRRLVREYLPLSFSRRHGDPSRPWNQFSINLKDSRGQSLKDYQGNWRDIFQNWEPLAYSYPQYLPAMISAFLNATTADGFNPYRVTRDGIEWETPEPDNPWANIGYWSDHQIIYLSKLLELQAELNPNWIKAAASEQRFSYAHVPYRIKPFAELRENPFNSIEFDLELNARIEKRVTQIGTDARLLHDATGQIVHANLIEKLLTLWLAKVSHWVQDGGIWMNTQRPEWNDANNALAGWGLSVVTVAYLHRHLVMCREWIDDLEADISISSSVRSWFLAVKQAFENSSNQPAAQLAERMLAADRYREAYYQGKFSTQQSVLATKDLIAFLDLVIPALADTLLANQRDDGLFHGYNVLHLPHDSIEIERLPLMLEGQVAILSAKWLPADAALRVLKQLRLSDLYRRDQHTYLLYPNKVLPSFTEKNRVDGETLNQQPRLKATLLQAGILTQSDEGKFHFAAELRNQKDLIPRLASVTLSKEEQNQTLALFEKTFQHKGFTGRSGSFFAYEGLGSTYWHMVSKLLLAIQEQWLDAVTNAPNLAPALAEIYYDVRAGLGFNKTPQAYGAFPTDPYSHTPETGQARQPGMTGQVKEELLTRLGELGLRWQQGQLVVIPGLLRDQEFNQESQTYQYLDVSGQWQTIELPANSMAFTLAQVPFVLTANEGDVEVSEVFRAKAPVKKQTRRLSHEACQSIQQRDHQLLKVEIRLPVLSDSTSE